MRRLEVSSLYIEHSTTTQHRTCVARAKECRLRVTATAATAALRVLAAFAAVLMVGR